MHIYFKAIFPSFVFLLVYCKDLDLSSYLTVKNSNLGNTFSKNGVQIDSTEELYDTMQFPG